MIATKLLVGERITYEDKKKYSWKNLIIMYKKNMGESA
mgnify:CR=1 FL=1|nr:MAG TPA: hypothetical protein [Caudoviricetes sp.]